MGVSEPRHYIVRMPADLQAGDPSRIRILPYTQWLLANGHVLRATHQQIQSAVPGKYYRQLPTVADSMGVTGRQSRVACNTARRIVQGRCMSV